MQSYIKQGSLNIHNALYRFLNDEVLSGLDISSDEFWGKFEGLLEEFHQRNKDLLARRSLLQDQISSWHKSNDFNLNEYKKFLKEIGYLEEVPADFTITTRNTDPEISGIPGPQLVVPIMNARFALNATNARWGSLYDALYGTDVISEEGGALKEGAYNEIRGNKVIDFSKQFLDQCFPITDFSYKDITNISVRDQRLLFHTEQDQITYLKNENQFKGFNGSPENPSEVLLVNNNLHLEIQIDPNHPVGKSDKANIKDIVLESAVSTIQDCEDSVAAVDAEDKVIAYRNWLGLMKGDLSETFEKKEKNVDELDLSGFRMGPAAKKLLKEKSLTTENIKTSSKKGVVTKKDILEAEKTQKEIKPSPVSESAKEIGSSERVPMTRLRSVVAKRLLESQAQTASLTTFNEVDLHEVKVLREKYKESFEEKFGVKLGFMGMFLKASSIALQEMPIVNASIDGDDIIYHGFQDIGVAVSTERGLVVPVVRNVQNLTIAEIELAIRDLSLKARDGKLDIDDMTGGTFTVSNGGVFGSLLSTPILNPPQSAILGMHKIQERPMAINGNVEIRPMMYLALTYDHRLLDGKDAVSFLVKIKEILESPESMILGV